MEVSLFFDVGAGDARIVVVLDGAALLGEPIYHEQRHFGMSLANMLVAVATQSRRVSAVSTLIRLQALTCSYDI